MSTIHHESTIVKQQPSPPLWPLIKFYLSCPYYIVKGYVDSLRVKQDKCPHPLKDRKHTGIRILAETSPIPLSEIKKVTKKYGVTIGNLALGLYS